MSHECKEGNHSLILSESRPFLISRSLQRPIHPAEAHHHCTLHAFPPAESNCLSRLILCTSNLTAPLWGIDRKRSRWRCFSKKELGTKRYSFIGRFKSPLRSLQFAFVLPPHLLVIHTRSLFDCVCNLTRFKMPGVREYCCSFAYALGER